MKKLFSLALCLLMLFAMFGCSANSTDDLSSIDIMELERNIVPMNWLPGTLSQFQQAMLESHYTFVIKVLVTENFENVLHYDKHEFEVNDGFEYQELISPTRSHILTEVIVLEIYRIGDNLSFEIGDTISLVEDAFITTTMN